MTHPTNACPHATTCCAIIGASVAMKFTTIAAIVVTAAMISGHLSMTLCAAFGTHAENSSTKPPKAVAMPGTALFISQLSIVVPMP